MAVKVEMKDNSKVVLKQLEGNVAAALKAMGIKAVNLILYQMRQGYGKPIRITGDLQRDVQYETDEGAQVVHVGNTLNYAPYVHEGTRHMEGRPYILDGLSGDSHAKQLRAVAEEALKQGF